MPVEELAAAMPLSGQASILELNDHQLASMVIGICRPPAVSVIIIEGLTKRFARQMSLMDLLAFHPLRDWKACTDEYDARRGRGRVLRRPIWSGVIETDKRVTHLPSSDEAKRRMRAHNWTR